MGMAIPRNPQEEANYGDRISVHLAAELVGRFAK